MRTALLSEIMDAPEFAEIMFLVGFILFLIEVIRLIAQRSDDDHTPRSRWGYGWLLVVAGLGCLALGFLASDNGADEDGTDAAVELETAA